MKTASVNEIKQELSNASQKELLAFCLRLVKYKKENKELLNYLLFEADDLSFYKENIKKEIDELFEQINLSNIYFSKKTIRKILKITNKYIRYTLSKETEVEMLIYFCNKLKNCGINLNKSTALSNLYTNQIKKIKSVAASLHEDLQHDYMKQVDLLL